MNANFATRAASWRITFAKGLLVALATVSFVAIGGDELGAPPQLEAIRLDGSRYELNDSRGSVAIVVIWSPDSLTSRKSLGELQRFTAKHPAREINVIAVSTLDDLAKLRHFANERQLSLPLASIGRTNLGPFAEPSLPYILVFDRNGQLHGSHRGLFRMQTLERLVAPLF